MPMIAYARCCIEKRANYTHASNFKLSGAPGDGEVLGGLDEDTGDWGPAASYKVVSCL